MVDRYEEHGLKTGQGDAASLNRASLGGHPLVTSNRAWPGSVIIYCRMLQSGQPQLLRLLQGRYGAACCTCVTIFVLGILWGLKIRPGWWVDGPTLVEVDALTLILKFYRHSGAAALSVTAVTGVQGP